MEPLDLTKQPPRSPWERLDGLVMMPRTIDKLRAQLPGGTLGSYKIPGTSQRLLDALGITEADLLQAVATASGDDDVAQWLREHTDRAAYERISEALSARRIRDVASDTFFERYPHAKSMPPDTALFDMLVADDAASFASEP